MLFTEINAAAADDDEITHCVSTEVTSNPLTNPLTLRYRRLMETTVPTPTACHEIRVGLDPKTFTFIRSEERMMSRDRTAEIWQLCKANCKNISVAQPAHKSG